MDIVLCSVYNLLLLISIFAGLSYASPQVTIKPYFTTVKNSSNHVEVPNNKTNKNSFTLQKRNSGSSELSAEPCSDGKSFCDDEADFPMDIVNNITNKYGSIINEMVERESDFNIVARMGDSSSEIGLCGAHKREIFPTKVQTGKGWRFVINTNSDSLRQSFKVEVCQEEGASCLKGYSDNFKCQQKYSYLRVLVLINENNLPEFRRFKVPSHCACDLKNIFS